MSNDLATIHQVVNLIAGSMALAARLEVDMREVSAAIAAGDDGLTQAAFDELVAGWHATDARERAAYRDRIQP